MKITPKAPKNESGLVQMIGMGKPIRHKGVSALRCVVVNLLDF